MAFFSALAGLTLFGANVLGLSFAGATIFASAALGLGVTLAGGLLSMALAPRGATLSTPQAQAVLNQSTGARIRGYGRAKLGGTRAFWDSRDGTLFQAIMLHSGEIDAYEQLYIGDSPVTVDGAGQVVQQPYYDPGNALHYAYIDTFLGSGSQPASSRLIGVFPGIWTSNHQLLGIAYLGVAFATPFAQGYQIVFPEGSNTPVRAVCRLSKVLDTRSSVTAWSDNASLVIRDYLTHPDGYRLEATDIDVPSFNAFANLCDEDVDRAGSGTEKRYRIWGVYSLTDEPASVLRKMLTVCDGELYQTAEGKVAIRGGEWEAPSVTIDGTHILGHSMEQGNNRFALFNELKVIYTSPDHDYQAMEATAWIDLADQAERGVVPTEFNADFAPSPAQARRCAKIYQNKANPQWKGRIVIDAYGLMALGERIIRVVIDELEIDDAFLVGSHQISPDLSSVEIEISSISETAYDWDAETEEGTNPPIPSDTAPDLTFPTPENPVLTSPAGGQVLLTVDDPERLGLTLQAEIRAGAGATWQGMATESQTTARAVGLPEDDYQVQARWLGVGEVAGPWFFPLAEITIP